MLPVFKGNPTRGAQIVMNCYQELESKLTTAGQGQLLHFWKELDAGQREKLANQIAELDFSELEKLIQAYVLQKPQTQIPEDLGPAPYFPLVPRNEEQKLLYAKAQARGEELLRSGKVCCLTVAGGQGTRLGFDGPKGTFPIGPVTGKTLFQYFAESILRMGEKYGCQLSWYVMTSPLNRLATETFFQENKFFGLDSKQVFFFTQGTMPAIGLDGKLLLADKDSLSLSPNGHGGTLLALRKSGALDRMKQEGTDFISYFQVDNPLIPVVNPLFLGLHDLEKSEMSAIMLAKTGPFEKLGNFCIAGGRLEIIEYSDLPAELAKSRNPDGTLRFIAGSPAIHMISRTFVEKLTTGGSLKLPWHRADKKVSYIDALGTAIKPSEPNAVKLESFIFDAMPLAERTMVLEGKREDLFAPTKNPTGVDSVESCRAMLINRDVRRLEVAGVKIPRNADGKVEVAIEISPRVVCDDADAIDYAKKHNLCELVAGTSVYLE